PSFVFFSSRSRRLPSSPLFPYTTLFRSCPHGGPRERVRPRGHHRAEITAKRQPDGARARCLGREAFAERDPWSARLGERTKGMRSEEHTSELQSLAYLVCRLLLEKKKQK